MRQKACATDVVEGFATAEVTGFLLRDRFDLHLKRLPRADRSKGRLEVVDQRLVYTHEVEAVVECWDMTVRLQETMSYEVPTYRPKHLG